MDYHIRAGIPTIEDYDALRRTSLFGEMEAFSNRFLESNRVFLTDYSRKWVDDPFHNFNRQWEYTFVFSRIRDYLKEGDKSRIRILDAGSGVTFFPYFVASRISDSLVLCSDYDSSLGKIYSGVSRTSHENVMFAVEDIHHPSHGPGTFDIVYCISVLEHTGDFKSIIREFKQLLTRGGLLLVTFDISIDGTAEIPIPLAEELVDTLAGSFPVRDPVDPRPLSVVTRASEVLTSRHIRRVDPTLLPWKHPFLSVLKSMLRLRMPRGLVKNITCFGQGFRND
jgi:SAM-dependent methyltransferase